MAGIDRRWFWLVSCRRSALALAGVAAVLSTLSWSETARAQDMEPRSYSASPVDFNFLIASFLRTTGSVSIDPSLPITDAKTSIDTELLGYDHTFALFGQTASAAIIVPYVEANVSGQVFNIPTQALRSGLGDLRLRFTENLLGNPAMSVQRFAERQPTTTIGTSLTIVVPSGDYNAAHLVNIGSNRWAFKPEIGASQPIGNWFVDGAAGFWFFTDNDDFFLGHKRGQAPLGTVQTDLGYTFRPGLWLSANGVYFGGGATSIDGRRNDDSQRGSRYGLTLSVPVTSGLSVKLSWTTWFIARNAGNYDTVGLTLQYQW
jgi:hypothetical protein